MYIYVVWVGTGDCERGKGRWTRQDKDIAIPITVYNRSRYRKALVSWWWQMRVRPTPLVCVSVVKDKAETRGQDSGRGSAFAIPISFSPLLSIR